MSLWTAILQYSPQAEGLLPKWQLFIAATAAFNSVQNLLTTNLTQRLYSRATVTPLQARSFAIWTITSAVIRAYAAYNINEKHVYDIAFFSYLIAFAHFSSEILIYRSTVLKGPAISPVIVSTVSLVWMFIQYDFYIARP